MMFVQHDDHVWAWVTHSFDCFRNKPLGSTAPEHHDAIPLAPDHDATSLEHHEIIGSQRHDASAPQGRLQRLFAKIKGVVVVGE